MAEAEKYFISEHLHRKPVHGGIGNVDIERILLDQGFKPIQFPGREDFSFYAKFKRGVYLVKQLLTLPRGSWVVFQFPLYAGMHQLLIWLLGYRKFVRIICLIADIDGLKSGNQSLLKKELRTLSRFHYFIAHNDSMKQWMIEKFPAARIEKLSFFDYLVKIPGRNRTKSGEIAFAGWLPKSRFLCFLPDLEKSCAGLRFLIYGPDPPFLPGDYSNMVYKGNFDTAELPDRIEGSFGLVWDGDSIDGPGGSYGDYMQYISHHKLSLYLVAGMPVITASWAGSAKLVEQYEAGFSVSRIADAATRIEAMSESEYQKMRNNCLLLASRITSGKNLSEALGRLMKEE